MIYFLDNNLHLRTTAIIFDKVYSTKEIIAEKSKILKYILIHKDNINLDLGNSARYPYGIFSFK